jgi:hypothetical protein
VANAKPTPKKAPTPTPPWQVRTTRPAPEKQNSRPTPAKFGGQLLAAKQAQDAKATRFGGQMAALKKTQDAQAKAKAQNFATGLSTAKQAQDAATEIQNVKADEFYDGMKAAAEQQGRTGDSGVDAPDHRVTTPHTEPKQGSHATTSAPSK